MGTAGRGIGRTAVRPEKDRLSLLLPIGRHVALDGRPTIDHFLIIRLIIRRKAQLPINFDCGLSEIVGREIAVGHARVLKALHRRQHGIARRAQARPRRMRAHHVNAARAVLHDAGGGGRDVRAVAGNEERPLRRAGRIVLDRRLIVPFVVAERRANDPVPCRAAVLVGRVQRHILRQRAHFGQRPLQRRVHLELSVIAH